MIKDNYLYYNIYDSINEFALQKDSIYIYGHSTEGRSYITEDLIRKYSGSVNFIEIKKIDHDVIIDINSKKEFFLRSNESIKDFFSQYVTAFIYIDSSGLNNRVWASLINNAFIFKNILNINDIKVIYAEPLKYQVIEFSSEGVFNDLSERIAGIEPLPGFASIIPYNDEDTFFVAFLGFEGGRFKYILEKIQPSQGTVYPVIGVPGFRAEYPFVAYWGNRRPLDDRDIWSNIKYVPANSAIDVYILLKKLLKESPSGRLKVAPIGTKPHAIGAILFAIKNPLKVELIYDNPKRTKPRTLGVGKIIEYSAYKLLNEK